MTRPKTRYPIESFGPELLALLQKAGRSIEPVTLSFERRRDAESLRARLHTLRSKMREQDHPEFHVAARVKISIFAEQQGPAGRDKPAKMVLRQRDSEFASIIREQAQVDTALDHDPLDDFPSPSNEEPEK